MLSTAKITIEVPYHELGLFIGKLPTKIRNRFFSILEQTYDMEIISMATGKPRQRLCRDMKVIVNGKRIRHNAHTNDNAGINDKPVNCMAGDTAQTKIESPLIRQGIPP